MAAAMRHSPAIARGATVRMQAHSRRRRGGGSDGGNTGAGIGGGGAGGDEAYGAGDEEDPGRAVEGEVFVQPEATEEGDDDVAEGGGGHDEGEVGPGERGHIAGGEADEEDDSGEDVGVGE